MNEEKKPAAKLGRIAVGTSFAFVIVGSTLFQAVLRDYLPPDFIAGGWFDANRTLAAGAVGGLSGLIGALIGYAIERARRAE